MRIVCLKITLVMALSFLIISCGGGVEEKEQQSPEIIAGETIAGFLDMCKEGKDVEALKKYLDPEISIGTTAIPSVLAGPFEYSVLFTGTEGLSEENKTGISLYVVEARIKPENKPETTLLFKCSGGGKYIYSISYK